MAQWLEHLSGKQCVVGSNPTRAALFSFRRKKELFGLVAFPFFLFIEKSFHVRGHARVRVACCCHILNNFLLFIFIIVIFAENASFTRKLRRHLLALMALTTAKPRNTDTNGIHATWA